MDPIDVRGPTDIPTRVALLEARVRLLSLAMKGFVALIIGSFVAYLLTKV